MRWPIQCLPATMCSTARRTCTQSIAPCAMAPLGGGDGYVGLHFEEYAGVLPPAFDSERIRELSEGRAYASITQGFGLMPAFGNLLSDDDRWTLVHLIFADPGMRGSIPIRSQQPGARRRPDGRPVGVVMAGW